MSAYRRPSRLSRATRGSLGRVSWGLADQAASSLTNLAVGVVAARSLSPASFGIFTIAWVTFGMVVNLSRGLATDPLIVRFSATTEESWRCAVRESSGTALTIGLVLGTVSVLSGLAIGGSVGAAFLALGVVLPALMLQDSWRFAFFAAGKGQRALVNDIVWGAVLVPCLLIATRYDSAGGFVLAWGAAAGVAACFGIVQTRIWPHPAGIRNWLEHHRDLGLRYVIENGSNSGSGQIRMYGLGAIAGFADVGAVRGAELLLGPFFFLLIGLSVVAVPEAARLLDRSPHKLVSFCASLGWGQAGAALAWGIGLHLLVPDSVGRDVLGSVWESSSDLLVPVTIGFAAAGLCTGAATGLRALGAARLSLRAQLFQSGSYVVGGLGGAALDGAYGSAWGGALALVLASAVWWRTLLAAVHSEVPTPETDHSRRDDPEAVQSREVRNG